MASYVEEVLGADLHCGQLQVPRKTKHRSTARHIAISRRDNSVARSVVGFCGLDLTAANGRKGK